RACRFAHLHGLQPAALLRLLAWQADCLGRKPRESHCAHAARTQGARGRGHQDDKIIPRTPVDRCRFYQRSGQHAVRQRKNVHESPDAAPAMNAPYFREGDKMAFEALLEDLSQRKEKALAMGGPEKLAKRKEQGVLNAHERLDVLLDEGTFEESGLYAVSHRKEVADRSPADGKIAGYGKVEGRKIAVVSNDFTVMGASSSVINGKKIRHMREVATKAGLPLVFLGESTGARMPDRMGAEGRAILGQDPNEYRRTRETPWVSALLGACYGSSTWYACLSDFVVMRKGATMAVASGRVTSMAIRQEIDSEELGGWRMHAETTGLIDAVADSDEEALELVKKWLGYLPSNQKEAPPVAPVSAADVPDT